jgi:ubiquinone/menaquinone biosynthesis C-methylase UbiE
LNCSQRQFDYVTDRLTSGQDPIVDLASGRCYLVEKLAARLHHPIVATDFSLRVLRQDQKRLESEGLYDRVSLLAFDARRTPFKDGAIKTLTTNLGLPNIQDPRALLKELRRVVRGTFLAISHFFPEDDKSNGEEIRKLKLETFMYRRTALESFSNANWQARIENTCTSRALPTPSSALIEDSGIDTLPVSETELEWCTLIAD